MYDVTDPKLWRRNSHTFVASAWVSMFGTSIVQFALTWYIASLTGSGGAMALAMIFGFGPSVVVTPLAGVWADRVNRRVMVVVGDALAALSTLVLMLVMLQGLSSLVWVYAAMALRSVGSAIQSPATMALVPKAVPQEGLNYINSLWGAANASVILLSPIVGAWVLNMMPLAWVLSIDVITALLGTSIFWFCVKVDGRPPKDEVGRGNRMADGLRYLLGDPLLRGLFVFSFGVMCFVAGLNTAFPLRVVRHFGTDPWYMSALQTMMGLGSLIGGLVAAKFPYKKNQPMASVATFTVLLGLTVVGIGLSSPLALAMAFSFLMGLALIYIQIPTNTLLFSATDQAQMGKVGALFMCSTSLTMPLGGAFFGWLSDLLPAGVIIALCGLGMVACGLLVRLNVALYGYHLGSDQQASQPSAPDPQA